MSQRPGTIHLPARDIAVPSTVSSQAQAVMANPPAERFEFPPLDDQQAWRAMIAAHDGAIAKMMAGRAAAPVTVVKRDPRPAATSRAR
jgi:epsilon-lactone hydrolase